MSVYLKVKCLYYKEEEINVDVGYTVLMPLILRGEFFSAAVLRVTVQ